MSISADQAVDAAIFLTIYRQAIHTLKYAHRNSVKLQFEITTMRSSKILPNALTESTTTRSSAEYCISQLDLQPARPHNEAVEQLEVHGAREGRTRLPIFAVKLPWLSYIFLKYLPNFINFKGNATDMLLYLKAQNAQLQNDILHWFLMKRATTYNFIMHYLSRSWLCLGMDYNSLNSKKARSNYAEIADKQNQIWKVRSVLL